MINKNNSSFFFLAVLFLAAINACSPAKGNKTGHEWMPDMGHAVTYEANVYGDYPYHSWNEQSVIDRKTLSMPRMPIHGTIPRGYAGGIAGHKEEGNSAIRVPMNGNVPYYYADNEDERLRAQMQIVSNPFPITAKGLAKGKDLYNIYCGICHGAKGDGVGYLVDESVNTNIKYPAQPANLIKDEFVMSSEGRYYHAIMYGKNVMGSYAEKLSYEERWQVIHYIRSLQAADKKLAYSEKENTLNPSIATPYAVIEAQMAAEKAKMKALEPAVKEEVKVEAAHGAETHDAHGGGGHH